MSINLIIIELSLDLVKEVNAVRGSMVHLVYLTLKVEHSILQLELLACLLA